MFRTKRLMGAVLIVLALVVALYSKPVVHADINACSASVSPDTVSPGSANNFNVSVSNSSANAIQWVDITVPASDFAYAGNSVSDWTTADHSDSSGTTLTGSTIDPGNNAT